MTRFLLAVTALAFLIPSSASAQTANATATPYPLGSPPIVRQFAAVDHLTHALTSTGGISGSPASHSGSVTVPDGAFVTGVEMGERENKPCMLILRWARIENGALFTGTTPWQGGGNCHSGGQSREWAYVQFVRAPEEPNAEVDLSAVTGLKVCQNNGSDRLKGLSVQGRFVDNLQPQYAGLGDTFQGLGFTRPNCNDPEPEYEACPNGRVVIGLDVHFATQGWASITGLAPICGRLRIHQ